MKKLFLKCILYFFLTIVMLEVFVRVFHLYKEVPVRYIDELGVEKSLPNQTGFAVTGNRRQNYSEYRINNFGFNSHKDFTPSEDKTEIALVGDSFIEGMHEDYYNSLGVQIENKLNNKVNIYEFGYAGYDLSSQLHLINSYKEKFKTLDFIVIYLKYEDDLDNSEYIPNKERIALLSSPLFKIRDNFKLLSYSTRMGILDPIKNLAIKFTQKPSTTVNPKSSTKKNKKSKEQLENFKKLINTYGFDKKRDCFLLDATKTDPDFLDYCLLNDYQIIDYGKSFKSSLLPPTLIYDQHWSVSGRDLVAEAVAKKIKEKLN